jgi:tetratricopeptide (TPR) repeat protein
MLHFIQNRTLVRSLIVMFSTVATFSLLRGQATGEPKEDFLYGEYYLIKGMYREALTFYLSALEVQPENSNLNYRAGLCYSKIIGEQHKALSYLKVAVRQINMHYIEGKFANSGAPIETWLLLGDAYFRDDQLREASKAYHEYKNLIGNSNPEMYKEVMNRISGLGISYEFQQSNREVCLINIGANINSRFSDYNPVISGDQKVMVYSQFWDSYDRIMITHMTENGWSQPIDISREIESEGDCYTSAVSFDGIELYLVCHNDMNYDLYLALFENEAWSPMKPLGGKVNSRYRESSVCVSSDGKKLYFASDRPGGEGGFDIYSAERTGSEWTAIKNLGKPVNTRGNEEAPYITDDNTVLYFSSDGHETVGNMDIMYTIIDSAAKWQEPVNIGVPVNTTNDDIFYSYFKETQTGYLSRDIPEGFGKNDIYRIQYGNCNGMKSDASVIQLKGVEDWSNTSNHTAMAENKVESENIKRDDIIENNVNGIQENSGDTILADYNFIEKQLEEALEDHQQDTGYPDNAGERSDSIPPYTIQVYALHKPLSSKKMNISSVKISFGDDGLYRYTYGEFLNYAEARKVLDEIWVSGYPDAFIRSVKTVPNYTK